MSFTFKQRSNRKYVSSRIICFFEYDQNSKELKIGFNDGVTGFYQDVPCELIDQFEMARSKGNFFYKNIHNSDYYYYTETL